MGARAIFIAAEALGAATERLEKAAHNAEAMILQAQHHGDLDGAYASAAGGLLSALRTALDEINKARGYLYGSDAVKAKAVAEYVADTILAARELQLRREWENEHSLLRWTASTVRLDLLKLRVQRKAG